jgi:DNA-binding Lrp family transcriptional regulator
LLSFRSGRVSAAPGREENRDRDEALLTERVALARAHGRSWNRIAAALGVSRQAARQRFGGKVGA